MKRLFAAAAAALLLSACATTSTPEMTEGKAVAGLWASLQAASEAVDVAVRAGTLKGATAATVAKDLTTATTLVTAADATYRANPTVDQTTSILQAAALLSQVLCIVQPTPTCATTPAT